MLATCAFLLTAFVAIQHIAFLVLEMFLWTKPAGMKVFGLKKDFAKATAALAANQGLYNGFLAAGLIWSLATSDGALASPLQQFFLGCVIIAGIFGGITVKGTIVVVQAVPALLALVLSFAGRG